MIYIKMSALEFLYNHPKLMRAVKTHGKQVRDLEFAVPFVTRNERGLVFNKGKDNESMIYVTTNYDDSQLLQEGDE